MSRAAQCLLLAVLLLMAVPTASAGTIVLPAAFDFDAENDALWSGNSFLSRHPHATAVRFPATATREQIDTFLGAYRDLYAYGEYDLMEAYYGYAAGDEAFDLTSLRSLSHIEIDADQPDFYAVDGVVYEKGTDVLYWCSPARAGALIVPEGTTAIGERAFIGCDRLTHVSLPGSVTAIGDWAFYLCAGLTSLPLPPGLQSIGERALSNCIHLNRLVIPARAALAEGALDYTTGLRQLVFAGDAAVDPGALARCHPDLIVYAEAGSPGQDAAARAGLRWAPLDGGEAALLPNPNHRHMRPATVYAATGETPLPQGTTVDILSVDGGVARVWAWAGEYDIPAAAVRETPADRYTVMEITLFDLKRYAGPSLASPSEARGMTRYAVLQRFGAWYLVEDRDGGQGYVTGLRGDVSVRNYDPVRPRVVQGETITDLVPLYAAPSAEARVLDRFPSGTQAIPLEGEAVEGFVQVEIDGRTGYIDSARLNWLHEEWDTIGY